MTVLVRQNIYTAWLDGDVTAIEALRSLCSDYEELDQSYKQFEEMREQLRQQLSEVVEKLGGRATIKGFGELTITAPSITNGYDKAALDDLIDILAEEHPGIAAQIAACRKKTARAGGLRIEREKVR